MQKSLLDQAVTRMKNITMDDTFRRVMLFSEEFNTKTTAFLDNPVSENPSVEYKMTLQELTSLFLLKIDAFSRGINLNDIDFFVQRNFFKNINNFTLGRGAALYEIKSGDNLRNYRIALASYLVCCLIFVVSFISIFRLSRIITPCLTALIVGFNFISEETLRKLQFHLNVQLSFLNEMRL